MTRLHPSIILLDTYCLYFFTTHVKPEPLIQDFGWHHPEFSDEKILAPPGATVETQSLIPKMITHGASNCVEVYMFCHASTTVAMCV